MSVLNKRNTQEQTILIYVTVARQMLVEKNSEVAEKLYKRALSMAEKVSGEISALSGSVLIELFYLYQETGRDAEAALVWQRVRNIMIKYHPIMSLQSICKN